MAASAVEPRSVSPSSSIPRPPIPRGRRVLYTAVVFGAFLLLLEGALGLVSPVELWLRRDEITASNASGRLIVCLGDSVTFGFGLPREQAWPARLQGWLVDHRLTGAGKHGLSVLNRAAGGSKVGNVVDRDVAWLGKLPAGSRPIITLMVGHNDLMRWGGMPSGPGAGLAPPPGAPTWTPRLGRLLLWALGLAREDLPEEAFSSADIALFGQQIEALQDATRKSGGELVLLTYLVPGEAGPEQSAELARLVHAKREHQLAINNLLRQVAEQRGLALLDLARTIPVPATWDPDVFIDDIHLSPEGHRRVGDAVGAWLLSTGRLTKTQ